MDTYEAPTSRTLSLTKLPKSEKAAYAGWLRHIAPEGEPLALAAIRAEGRRFRTCSQTEALRTIQAMLGVAGPLDAFIQAAVDDEGVRQQRTALLRAQAQSFSYPDFTPTAPS